jgi:NADH dehydrogenase
MADKHRVVILGAGFGGLYAAQALKHVPVSVTVIDKRNFHLFQPLLYQVATGSLSPGEIAAPIRSVLATQTNTRVLLGEVVDIDPSAKRIWLRDGAQVEYDTLIVATGSQSAYFGHEDWREWAPSLKSVEEATVIRHKILVAFEAAERVHDPEERRAWLTFVIVGAGATGVELAGALSEIARHTLKHEFRSFRPEDARIFMLDRAPRVLTAYPEDLSKKAEDSLVQLGVRVRNGVTVEAIDSDGVVFEAQNGRERLPAKTVLWAAGVTVSEFGRQISKRTGAETDKSGKIKVAPDLSIPGYPEIFVIGDLALTEEPLPGVAQVAMQGGKYVAKVIAKRLEGKEPPKAFHYFNKGDMAVIGRNHAVANVFGWHLSGLLAWLIWLFIHLMYIVEFQSRIVVFVQWGLQYITFSRGARLITGKTALDSVIETQPLKNTIEA